MFASTIRNTVARAAALWLFSAAALLAQSLTGTWQGTLQAGKELRVLIKISTTEGDTLKATFYSIDQGSQGIPSSAVTLSGSTVKMVIPGVGGTYEGKLSADGNSIAGTWAQGPSGLPLNLARATPATAWAIPEAPPPTKPMRADADPAFEVATIKPSKPEMQGKGFTVRGRRFITLNTSLSDLITFAYDIHPKQITGGPAWLETDRYDVTGEPDTEGQPSLPQWKTMMRKMLTDRFKLTFHHDKKELSVYAIVLSKTGPKLTKSEGDPNGLPGLMFRGLGVLPARNATITEFATVMQSAVLDRPVIDRTGLAGRWDFTLTWTPDQSQFGGMGIKVPPPSEDAAAPPDLFTAMAQQLGLKMDATKAPVDVIAVDHVEKPTEN